MSQKRGLMKAHMRQRHTTLLLTVGILILLLNGCTPIKMVQPYDAKLFNDTETFFKKADAMIELGKSVSPRDDSERALILKPDQHPGHISAFESKYNQLLLDSDALILRAIANSQVVDYLGSQIQKKVNEVIDQSLPSSCENLEADAARTSLTAMNFVDLKCIVIKWKDQHNDQKLTKGKSILKKGNWEGRKITLFDAVLAIQKAEGFKKTNR
jgi:hypothetical protein